GRSRMQPRRKRDSSNFGHRFRGSHQIFSLRRGLGHEGECSSASPSLCYSLGMTRGIAKQNFPVVGVFFGLLAVSLGGLVLLPPIPQDQSYHQFADQRTIFGIPNFWNVVSNLPFLAAGAAGVGGCLVRPGKRA